MKREYFLLGFIILGKIWLNSKDLYNIYEEYEKWLNKDPNNWQTIKWCTTLRLSKFENTKENKAKYIEIFKFVFREVRVINNMLAIYGE